MDAKTKRMIAFIESQGGCSKVASKCGKRAQFLYNIKNKGLFPSAATLELIANHYGDAFDINWIIKGSKSEIEATYTIPASELEKENQKLKEQLKEVELNNVFVRLLLKTHLPKEEQEQIKKVMPNFNERAFKSAMQNKVIHLDSLGGSKVTTLYASECTQGQNTAS